MRGGDARQYVDAGADDATDAEQHEVSALSVRGIPWEFASACRDSMQRRSRQRRQPVVDRFDEFP